MATPSASASGESTPAPATFSYAQAAKGKAAPTAGLAQASSKLAASEKVDSNGEKSNWAEDGSSAAADTSDTLTNGLPAKQTTDNQRGLNTASAEPSSAQPDSAWSAAHEDDAAKTSKDASSDQRSNVASETSSQNAGDVQSRRGSAKEKKNEKPAAETMKDAPPPSVNIWAQRAHDAKAKQSKPLASPAATAPADPSPQGSRPTKPVASSPVDAPTDASASTRGSTAAKIPASRATEAKGAPQRGGGVGEKTVKAAQVPSVSDATLWPTPLTAQSAQEQERKKALEKLEKPAAAEADRPVAKTHKNEWVPVPFTPTVKFETPMPGAVRRTTARPAGRGGRGGGAGASFTDRPARPGAAATDSGTEQQDADEGSLSRSSSSLPAKSKKPSNGGQPNTDGAPLTDQGKRPSLQEESTLAKSSPVTAAPTKQANPEMPSKAPQGVDAKEDTGVHGRTKRTEATAANVNGVEPTRNQTKAKPTRAEGTSTHAGAEGEERRKEEPSTFSGKSSGGFRKGDGGRDGSPPQRGGREGRRGRGGRGGGIYTGANGHSSQHSSQGPHSAKASTFQAQYAQQYAPFLPNARGGSNYRSNGPRSASIPSGFGPGLPYATGVEYDLANIYNVGVPTQQYNANGNGYEVMMITNGVAQQLTYYFSLDNLLKDTFLRSHMDSQGFVSLQLIADFKRMKSLTADVALLRQVCLQTPALELRTGSDGKERVRVREGWEKWVLPMEERKESARNDGPLPERNASSRGPMSPNNLPFSPEGFYPPHFGGMMPPYSPMAMGPQMNGFGGSKSSRHSVGGMPMHDYYGQSSFSMSNGSHMAPSDEGDAFPDTSISALTVVVRPQDEHNARKPLDLDSRTFSNGSLDGEALESAAAKEKEHEGSNGNDDRTEKIAELRRTLTGQSQGKAKNDVALFWIKEKEDPETIPEGTVTEPYTHLHTKALQQRKDAKEGDCPYDLEVLYQFWSHFLVRNYNGSMYNEFRQLAHEDASLRAANKGMQNLVQYYGHSLSSQHAIRHNVLQHYIELVKNEDPGKDRLAFKQLRNAWRDGSLNFRNRKRLIDAIDLDLKAELER